MAVTQKGIVKPVISPGKKYSQYKPIIVVKREKGTTFKTIPRDSCVVKL
jgi:hypothetical protein